MKRRKDFTHYPRWEDRELLRLAVGIGFVVLIALAKWAYETVIAWGWWTP